MPNIPLAHAPENPVKIQAPVIANTEAPDTAPASAVDAAGAARRQEALTNAPAARAQVQISPLSASLVQDNGDVDMERVEAIRNAIRSGELQIDASRIADGLLDSVREMVRR